MDPEIIAEADLMIEAPRSSALRGYDRAEVDAFVHATRSRLQTMADRLGHQKSELDRLESENRSFSRTIDIAVTAAEEVMAEATATAASTVAEAEAHAAQILEIADRRASELVATTTAEAHERLLVAKADARDAMRDEREHIEAELEMTTAVKQRVTTEQQAFEATKDELITCLRQAGEAILAVAEDPIGSGRQLLDQMRASAAVDLAEEPDATPADPVPAFTAAFDPLADLDEDEAASLDAKTEFFSTEIEDDPSRKWILG